MKHPKWVLPIIVISQFFCTSLWFAGNAIINDLTAVFSLPENTIGHFTSAVQLGFICGTFLFALFAIADRSSPSRIFFISAILASTFNFALIFEQNTLTSLLSLRFLTGFFLAGIYPVGMKSIRLLRERTREITRFPSGCPRSRDCFSSFFTRIFN